MKIKNSVYSRRKFLNGLLGGGLGSLAAILVSPIIKFVFPPYKEPDEVILAAADFKDMPPGSVKNFAWGLKPGFLRAKADGTLTAYVGVCTHLDCNVTWRPEQRKFFCACHDGWYDEDGKNIQGPPPKPMRVLEVSVDGENLFVRRPGFVS